MATVKGRLWPMNLPGFAIGVRNAEGGVYVREGFEATPRPGDFRFWNEGMDATDQAEAVHFFEFACPRTGKYCGAIRCALQKPAETPSWGWDGNMQAPTLRPSVNCISGCGWHGWVTNGEFSDA